MAHRPAWHRYIGPRSVNESESGMVEPVPATELSAFSSPNATPTEWSQARDELAGAEVYWLSTVRRDGCPHVTPLLGIWLEGALYFCTGRWGVTSGQRHDGELFGIRYSWAVCFTTFASRRSKEYEP